MSVQWITPDWPAPPGVRACSTLRGGGTSLGAYGRFNLGVHVGDMPEHVSANRRLLRDNLRLPAEPFWLNQVHGTAVVEASIHTEQPPQADAAFTNQAGIVCVVMTADCLPVLLCSRDGQRIAAAHAGWRGLADGVLQATVAALGGEDLMAWLGPAIGPQAFEVGADVRLAFLDTLGDCAAAFQPTAAGRYWADLYALARIALAQVGVTEVYGGEYCTHTDAERFFSYRRDGQTGRMATLIWRECDGYR